jgi:hypothetical protein
MVNLFVFERMRPPCEERIDAAIREEWTERLSKRLGHPPKVLGNKLIIQGTKNHIQMTFRRLTGVTDVRTFLDVFVVVAAWDDPEPSLLETLLDKQRAVEPFLFRMTSEGVLLLGFQRTGTRQDLHEAEALLADLLALVEEVRTTFLLHYPDGTIPDQQITQEWLLRPGSGLLDLREQRRDWCYEREKALADALWAKGNYQQVLENATNAEDLSVRRRLLLDVAQRYMDNGLNDQVAHLWNRLDDADYRGRLLLTAIRGTSRALDSGPVRDLFVRWLDEQSRPEAELPSSPIVRDVFREASSLFGEEQMETCYPPAGSPTIRLEWLAWMAEEKKALMANRQARWETELGSLISNMHSTSFLDRLDSAVALYDALKTLGWNAATSALAEALQAVIRISPHESYYALRLGFDPDKEEVSVSNQSREDFSDEETADD